MSDLFRKYLISLAAITIATAASVFAVCLFVDPYRMLGLMDVPGLNARKPQAGLQIRITKVYDAARAEAHTLLLGNSRVEVGLDPNHPELARRGRAFNLAVPGAGLYEQFRYLQHAQAAGKPRLLILGLDFVDFLVNPDSISPFDRPPADFEGRLLVKADQTPNDRRLFALVKDGVTSFFSLNAATDTLQTLIRQQYGHGDRTRDGFNPLDEYVSLVRTEGHAQLFAQRDRENLQQRLNGPKSIRGRDGRLAHPFDTLRRVLEHCVENRIDVLLFIHPYHVRLLETFQAAQLEPVLEEWKFELARFVAAFERKRNVEIPIWDFALYSDWTREPVPAPGDRKTAMKWYWEAGHYKRELGDELLGIMLETRQTGEGARRLVSMP